MGHRLACALALSLFTSLCLADDWASYQHDVNHTGRSEAGFDPRQLRAVWSVADYYSPLVLGDTLYASKRSAAGVTAFDVMTGTVRWTYTDISAATSIAVGEGMVIFGGGGSLVVLDAKTGGLRYTVPFPSYARQFERTHPIIHRNEDGTLHAYVAAGPSMVGVDLGRTGGTVRWAPFLPAPISEMSLPTLARNDLLTTAAGSSAAWNRDTGQTRPLPYSAGITGGGGASPVFDEDLNRIYVTNRLSLTVAAVIAFDVAGDGAITKRWQYTGPAVALGGAVAVGADGSVFTTGSGTLAVLDPDTGQVLRSRSGQPVSQVAAPALTPGYVWLCGNQTLIYDADTLELVKTLPRVNNPGHVDGYIGPGAIFGDDAGTTGGFVLDWDEYAFNPGPAGLDVYLVPEPAGLMFCAMFALKMRRTAQQTRRA